jgi:hypothetical protein
MIPYKTSDDSPRTRFNPGADGDEVCVTLIFDNYMKKIITINLIIINLFQIPAANKISAMNYLGYFSL